MARRCRLVEIRVGVGARVPLVLRASVVLPHKRDARARMWRPFEKVSTAARRWTSPIPLCTLLESYSLVPSMRLITFDDPVRRSRIGALAADGRIVDLNTACAVYVRDVENEGAYDRLSGALVPPNMRKLFAGGDTSLEAARKAFDYVLGSNSLPGPRGEPIFAPASSAAR